MTPDQLQFRPTHSQSLGRWVMLSSLVMAMSLGFSMAQAQLIELAPPAQFEPPTVLGHNEIPELLARQDQAKSALDFKTVPSEASVLAPPISAAPELELPATVRAIPSIDAQIQAQVDGQLKGQPLGARELGCQAAQRWMPAIGLKQRAQTVHRLYIDQPESKRQAAAGIVQFLCLQAYHQEDLAAATAMRSYYSRIGIAEQKQFIDLGKQAVAMARVKQQKLLEKGLPAGVDLSSLDRQGIDLQDQLLQANTQDNQLRRLLASMTCVDYAVEDRTLEPLIVEASELDCDCMIAIALRERYDLQSWRCLCQSINEESAPLILNVIATSVGSYGVPIPQASGLRTLLCSDYDKELLAKSLRQEVATILRTNESYVEQSVVEKCSQLQLAYERLELQKQRRTSWEYRIKQIERLESLGDARPSERATAETGLLKAKSDEAARRLDAKLAEVSLAEVVGGLAGKCCRGEAWLPR